MVCLGWLTTARHRRSWIRLLDWLITDWVIPDSRFTLAQGRVADTIRTIRIQFGILFGLALGIAISLFHVHFEHLPFKKDVRSHAFSVFGVLAIRYYPCFIKARQSADLASAAIIAKVEER